MCSLRWSLSLQLRLSWVCFVCPDNTFSESELRLSNPSSLKNFLPTLTLNLFTPLLGLIKVSIIWWYIFLAWGSFLFWRRSRTSQSIIHVRLGETACCRSILGEIFRPSYLAVLLVAVTGLHWWQFSRVCTVSHSSASCLLFYFTSISSFEQDLMK